MVSSFRQIKDYWELMVTPKVLANFRPGLSNPGTETGDGCVRTLKGLQPLSLARLVVTLSGLGFRKNTLLSPGLPKLNPGLKLANTFGVLATLSHSQTYQPPNPFRRSKQ
jgi:hypothetical protein